MINVAILHYSCPPVIGGVEEIVRQQASVLYRYYHPVKVIAGSGSQFTEDFVVEINPLLSSTHPEISKLQQSPTENHELIQKISGTICTTCLSNGRKKLETSNEWDGFPEVEKRNIDMYKF